MEAVCLVQTWHVITTFTLCYLPFSSVLSLTFFFLLTHSFCQISRSSQKHHEHAQTQTSNKSYCSSSVQGLESFSEINVQLSVTNQTELMELWYTVCEHCVPVKAITHYPLSLSALWLFFSVSLSHSPTFLSFFFCRPVHNCTAAFL